MPATPVQKLKIKEGFTLLTIGAPADFEKALGTLPAGVRVSNTGKTYDQVHWFVRNIAQREGEEKKVLAMLKEGVTLWIYFPKGSSKIQTDLTRDHGWGDLPTRKGLQWLSLVSFDETWSAFALRLQTGADEKRETKPKENPVAAYADAATKTITLPGDMAKAFLTAPEQKAFFDTLSFTNRKEYVEWVVSAKREETRKTRVAETIERLGKGWKNPAGR
ncbi:YdeI/OmpD-associated family protein [Flavisolibacter sp. BT320]|nr:YdeI/OmpD-associated family protein [Flavisolibacter longurius]